MAAVSSSSRTHLSVPPVMNTAAVSNIIGQYLTDFSKEELSVISNYANAIFSQRTSDERTFLSPEQVFNALGEDSWKDILDAEFHHLGPMVFDKGLHKRGIKEPGYYQGIMNACTVAAEYLTIPTTLTQIGFYRQLHIQACSHFTGERSDGTLVEGAYAGKFLSMPFKSTLGSYGDLFLDDPLAHRVTERAERRTALRADNHRYGGAPPEDQAAIRAKYGVAYDYDSLSAQEQITVRENFGFSTEGLITPKHKKIIENYLITEQLDNLENVAKKEWKRDFGTTIQTKIKALNAYIAKKSAALGITDAGGSPLPFTLATLGDEGKGIRVYFSCPPDLYDVVVERLFENFRKDIATAASQPEKLRCIAELFQMLEWTHAYPDGQTRTDLVLLKAHLVANGFTPAFLDDPNLSIFCMPDVWAAYLEKGMEKWQKEFARKRAATVL